MKIDQLYIQIRVSNFKFRARSENIDRIDEKLAKNQISETPDGVTAPLTPKSGRRVMHNSNRGCKVHVQCFTEWCRRLGVHKCICNGQTYPFLTMRSSLKF